MSTPKPPSFPPPPGPPQGPPPGFPPPGPPPGFPPGFPPPGPPPRKGNTLWIVLGVVGVLALVGVIVGLVLLLAGSDGDDDKAGDDPSTVASGAAPDEVVKSLVDAAEEGDCDQAKTYLTAAAAAADPCSAAEFRLLSSEDVDAEVGDAQVDGSEATVPVTFTSSAGSSDYEFVLQQVDGEWRVASYAEGDGASPTPADPSSSSTDLPSTGTPSPSGTSTASAVANEPGAVVTAFLSSALAGDCATAEDLVTPAYLKSEGRCTTSDLPSDFGSKAKYTVGKASVKGSTATVPIKLTYAGKDDSSTVTLTQTGGRWLISGID